jgi:hypothetical protein
VIACKPLISPETTASAQRPFAGVQFSRTSNGDYHFFDSRTGELWLYFYDHGSYTSNGKYRLTKLGQPLVDEK